MLAINSANIVFGQFWLFMSRQETHMTVLDKSSNELLSELELAAAKPRRLTIQRKAQASIDDSLVAAKVHQQLQVATAAVEARFHDQHNELIHNHETALSEAREESYRTGLEDGRRSQASELDESFEDDVNSRICDRDRKLPWAVGVIVAGEQHRILQALADWLDEVDQPELNASTFAFRALNIPWYPERTPAPDPVDKHNCEEPPITRSDQKLGEIHFPPHWIYYADQLAQD
jgi:hypothetical protein